GSDWDILLITDPDTFDNVALASGTGNGLLESMCTDGSSLYYKRVGSNVITKMKVDGTGAPSTVSLGDPAIAVTGLMFAAGRLLPVDPFSSTPGLVEVKAATTTYVATYEPGQMPFFTAAVTGPSGIYMAGNIVPNSALANLSGLTASIYRCSIDENTG